MIASMTILTTGTLTMSLSKAVTWMTVVSISEVSDMDALYDGCSNSGLLSLISNTLIRIKACDVLVGSLTSVAYIIVDRLTHVYALELHKKSNICEYH